LSCFIKKVEQILVLEKEDRSFSENKKLIRELRKENRKFFLSLSSDVRNKLIKYELIKIIGFNDLLNIYKKVGEEKIFFSSEIGGEFLYMLSKYNLTQKDCEVCFGDKNNFREEAGGMFIYYLSNK